jgi:hypothetical protein
MNTAQLHEWVNEAATVGRSRVAAETAADDLEVARIYAVTSHAERKSMETAYTALVAEREALGDAVVALMCLEDGDPVALTDAIARADEVNAQMETALNRQILAAHQCVEADAMVHAARCRLITALDGK